MPRPGRHGSNRPPPASAAFTVNGGGEEANELERVRLASVAQPELAVAVEASSEEEMISGSNHGVALPTTHTHDRPERQRRRNRDAELVDKSALQQVLIETATTMVSVSVSVSVTAFASAVGAGYDPTAIACASVVCVGLGFACLGPRQRAQRSRLVAAQQAAGCKLTLRVTPAAEDTNIVFASQS